MIHQRILPFSTNTKSWPHNKSVFKKNLSTMHAVLNFITATYDNIKDNSYTGILFLDLSKAFDTVCHQIILGKLEHYGTRGPCLQLLNSFLKRKQFYSLDGVNSELQSNTLEYLRAVADPENFGGGDLKPKPQKFGCLHQNWEWFFGRNRKFKRSFRPKSGGLQKKKKVFTKIETDFSAEIGNSNVFFAQNQVVSKKKKVLTKIETDFSAGFVTFRSVGGMHPEMEPNYSK